MHPSGQKPLSAFFKSFLCLQNKDSQPALENAKSSEITLVYSETPQPVDTIENKTPISQAVEIPQNPPCSARTTPELLITGMGTQYPPYLVGPDEFEAYTRKWSDVDSIPGIQKMLQINRLTGIETRAIIRPWTDSQFNQPELPNICDLDAIFRTEGVALAVQACEKAIAEWGGSIDDITHTVGVTSTNTGAPGYDYLVARELGLSATVEQTLLAGVGCAGGMSALRNAANIACAASARGQAARILVMACEVNSVQMRCALESAARNPKATKIAPVLFGDGAAAFIMCNELASEARSKAIYALADSTVTSLPNSMQDMGLFVDPLGFRVEIAKEVAVKSVASILPTFKKMLPSFIASSGNNSSEALNAQDFDWAVHPGGIAILKGAQHALQLSPQQLRASYQIYKSRGNTASVTVLSVLDKLRTMGEGRDNIVACSFGPGMTIEMATLRRCRS